MLDKILSNDYYLKNREILLFVIDLMWVFASFMFSFLIGYNFNLELIFKNDSSIILIIIVLIVYGVVLIGFKIHKSLWRYIGIKEVFRIGLSILVATISVLLINIVFIKVDVFNSIICFGGILSILFMCNLRMMYRLLRNHQRINQDICIRTIIAGAGDGGYILMKDIVNNPSLNVNLVGFVDDLKAKKTISGYEVLGTTFDIPDIVNKYRIERIYLAMPSATKNEIERILDICQTCKGLETKILKRKIVSESLDGKSDVSVEDISIEDLLGRGEVHLDQHKIATYITGETVLVTGAGGSIGSELCRQLVKFKPNKLLMLDVNENGLYMLEQEFNRNRRHGRLDENVSIVSLVASIRDEKAINYIMANERPGVVFHAAAHKHVPLMETRPVEAIKNNVFGTQNVIKACIKSKVKRFIMISTDKAVNPTNVMGASKRMTEMILQSYGNNGVTKIAAVRFGNVLGSNGSVIPIFKEQIKEGGPVTITHKDITRYFMTIPEAAQLVLEAGSYADKGEIFVLDMGEPVKILSLAEKLIRLSGLTPGRDIEIKEIGLRPGEKMFEELKLGVEKRYTTSNDLIFVNEIIPMERKFIDDKLKQLKNCLDGKTTNVEIKDLILELIKDDNKEIN
ncbi:MAG: nucleoside-diphosphate sugar epimerase/dehydratase [Erysipelotrichaceae bacterium]